MLIRWRTGRCRGIGGPAREMSLAGRLVGIEEGQAFCGFGAEVVAAVYQALSSTGSSLSVRRIGAKPHPLASSKAAELDSLPGADTILAGVVEMVTYA